MGAAQRTTLRIGEVAAEIALVKASGDPKEAKYEVRRDGEPAASSSGGSGRRRSPLGGDVSPPAASSGTATAKKAEIAHGVTGPDGSFVDLTSQLAAIDEACILDGVEVVATVAASSVPRSRARGAYYISAAGGSSVGAPAQKVLALVWSGLRTTRSVAIVRWTKRTNQALGVLSASDDGGRHLVLVEIEWAQNVHEVPVRALLGEAIDETSEAERAAALDLIRAMTQPEALRELRDERLARRAELLEAARAGETWEPPPELEAPPEAADLLLALAG